MRIFLIQGPYYLSRAALRSTLQHFIQEAFQDGNADFYPLVYHKIFLPRHSAKQFERYNTLWDEIMNLPQEVDPPYLGLHFIVHLPAMFSLRRNIKLCKQIMRKYINNGFAVQLDIYNQNDMSSYYPGHLLIPPFIFSANGEGFNKWVNIGLKELEEK